MNVCYRCRHVYVPEEHYRIIVCLHPDVEREPTISPITGEPVYVCSGGGMSTNKHPPCDEFNSDGDCPYYAPVEGAASREKVGEETVIKYGQPLDI